MKRETYRHDRCNPNVVSLLERKTRGTAKILSVVKTYRSFRMLLKFRVRFIPKSKTGTDINLSTEFRFVKIKLVCLLKGTLKYSQIKD